MTKKLSELFNLPEVESIPETIMDSQTAIELTEQQRQTISLADQALDKIGYVAWTAAIKNLMI
jgi:hypothetical protein